MRAKRVFFIVLDGMGMGEAPDAALFGDAGAFTLQSVYRSDALRIPYLTRLGLGNLPNLSFLGHTDTPTASIARLQEASQGKDTTIGHWELAGHISHAPLPTFPNGFPTEFLQRFSQAVGREILCNRPYSGTDVIRDYGEEHLRTGALIVYTSADSVFQVAAHTDVVPLEELYDICRTARKMLTGELAVGRVIARPFCGNTPDFKRTADRRDFSLAPPVRMMTDAIRDAGLDSISVGKISDIFAGHGITQAVSTHSNEEGMAETLRLARTDFCGLCFVNLVEFDSLWGHRRDPRGYAEGLSRFDAWLGEFLPCLREDDVLIITADHGCDPAYLKTTDHTREYVPFLLYSPSLCPQDLGTRRTFADAGATVAALLCVDFVCDGSALPLKNLS